MNKRAIKNGGIVFVCEKLADNSDWSATEHFRTFLSISFKIATPELGKSRYCTNGGESSPNDKDNLHNIDKITEIKQITTPCARLTGDHPTFFFS